MNLIEHLQQSLAVCPSADRWVVAYSGGLDSTVLLHAVQQWQQQQIQPVPVVALHVHHGLSAYADQWQNHCRDQAMALGVEFTAQQVRVRQTGDGLEQAARDARYQVFSDFLQAGDVLLMAHHLDDQAETLLLRLVRASGPKGLAAMPVTRPIGKGILWRPLLDCPREVLEQFARDRGLRWIEDDSNQDERLDRNFIRHQVMPMLRQRWPDVARQWATSAQLCGEQQALLESVAADDLRLAGAQQSRAGASIDVNVLAQLSDSRRNNLLRYWCGRLGIDVPGRVHLAEISRQCMQARVDTEACVQWGQVQCRPYQGRLYLFALTPVLVADQCQPLPQHHQVSIAGMGVLGVFSVDRGGLDPRNDYQIRARQGGERCHLAGRKHSHSLKKLLQQEHVAPWLRDQLPLIYCGDRLAAVADLWVCEGFSVKDGPGWQLNWQPASALPEVGED